MIFFKADQLHSLKKFCILSENVIFYELIRTSPVHTNTTPTVITHSCVLQKPPSCNDNGYKWDIAVWHTIAFKVSAFHFLGQKLADVPICSTFLSSNL